MPESLPEPACELGYTRDQLEHILGTRITSFHYWMRGQTVALCDDHGMITYTTDLRRFLRGGPIDD